MQLAISNMSAAVCVFDFKMADCTRDVVDFFGRERCLESFGITGFMYDGVQELHQKLMDGNELNMSLLNSEGFYSIVEAQHAFAVSYLYNAYDFACKYIDEIFTVHDVMEHAYIKACYLAASKGHEEIVMSPPAFSGNIVEYLEKFTIEEYVAIGW